MMSKVYRAKCVALLGSSDIEVELLIYDILFRKEWVVHAKRPFTSPQAVLEYLGRYKFKIAICQSDLVKEPKPTGFRLSVEYFLPYRLIQ